MKFFVSYSRSVQDKVRQIIDSLRDDGEEVWWDQDLRAGQDWWGTILDNIEQSQVCLFMVSEKSVQSPYCMDELRYALARNRLVLPYVMEGLPSYPLPPEIMQGRIQYEPYSGTPDHLKERIVMTCKGIDWAQYKDRYTMRPPEPNTGSNDLVDRLDKAIALANEGLFEAAVTGFNNVAHNDYASYGDFCHQWIDKINRYKEIASLAQRAAMKKLALPKWEAFLRQSAGDVLFDPLGIAAILGVTGAAVSQGMSAEAYANRAYVRPNHDYDLKIADYTEAIRLNPQYVSAYVNRGLSYVEKGDHARAIADFTEALRLDPHVTTAYVNRGASYADQGDHARAIADYSEALRLNPQDVDAYNNRGASYDAIGDYKRAIADYSEALRLNPQDADAYNNRGNGYYATKDYQRALADFDEAVRLNPLHPLARLNRGLCYMACKEYEKALIEYNEVLRVTPNSADAYDCRGEVYRIMGDFDRAITDYRTALRLDPQHPYAPRGLQAALEGKTKTGQ